jgi:DNA-binding MarR family transcriptional regulator
MVDQYQTNRGQDIGDVLVLPPAATACSISAKEWREDLLLSLLFRTSIRLQTSLDRCFLRYGLTLQEATVLVRCVEANKITAGKLAVTLGRDCGKITKFIDRLELGGLVKRDHHPHDRRYLVIKPTAKGRRTARSLAWVFTSIRRQLFVGIVEDDMDRLGKLLVRLHKNASRMSIPEGETARRRIGVRRTKSKAMETREPQLPLGIRTHSSEMNGSIRMESGSSWREINAEGSSTPGNTRTGGLLTPKTL